MVEKAVSTLGEAPTGLRDVFELCRGFEKAFSNIVNVSWTVWQLCWGSFQHANATCLPGALTTRAVGQQQRITSAAQQPHLSVGTSTPATHPANTCSSSSTPLLPPTLQESPVANRIKEAFFSEKGLAGNVHRLPFDKLFAIDSVKKVGPFSKPVQPAKCITPCQARQRRSVPCRCALRQQ